MRYFFIILSFLFLTSCGSYTIVSRQPQISHVLALTTEGDTLKVPIQELQRNLTPDYYSGYRFYWNNSWWLYNDWYWNYWYQNPRWFYPRTQIVAPRNRVRIQAPRYNSSRVNGNRANLPRVTPNRGRTNGTVRSTPQRNTSRSGSSRNNHRKNLL